MNLRRVIGDVMSILLLVLLVVISDFHVSATGGVFQVQHKFAGRQPSLSDIKEHDRHRHGRFLSAVDLPLGGDGKPTGTGLYFTKIKIGQPSKDYYVHVDTGSDLFWVNCIHCNQCPKKSSLGIKLTLYDPSSSVGSEPITCDQDFCTLNSNGPIPGCIAGQSLCAYQLAYGDGSRTGGFFVRDNIQYDRVSGNLQTTSANSSVILGCSTQQSGNLQDSGVALDGILGFGQSETSMISQISASGSMKKMFAHCLDGKNGGGIFAMGNVVQPKVKTTPMVPNKSHYNVNLGTIQVGKDIVPIGNGQDTIVDSGTTLAYFPQAIYDSLVQKILSNHGDLQIHTVENSFQCFSYNASVDAGFPTVTLNFEGSLQLVVYPHDYLFPLDKGEYCIGWQSTGSQSKDVKDVTLLGDLILSNKLVVYDIENQTIGWTEYNCASTIGVQDDQSNAIYQVGAHHLTASASSQNIGSIVMLLLCAILHILTYKANYS